MPPIGLADVDDRQVQAGKDIDIHPFRQAGRILDAELLADRLADRQAKTKRQGDQGHHDRERTAKSGNDQIHRRP